MLSFADKPTLRGSLVTLRPVERADAAELAAADPETERLTGSHDTFPLERLEEWYATRGAQTDRIDWSIVENASGAWAGEVVVNDLGLHRIELEVYDFNPRAAGLREDRLPARGHRARRVVVERSVGRRALDGGAGDRPGNLGTGAPKIVRVSDLFASTRYLGGKE